jgi:hypothetical protein
MKKVFLAAIIAFGFASCSTDENDTPTNTTSQFANVSADFSAPSKLTGKTITRGSIPVSIEKLTVSVINATGGLITPDVIFDVVASGGTNDYTIPGVFAGYNTFSAVSTMTQKAIDDSATSGFKTITGANATELATNTAAALASDKLKTPYAIYNSIQNVSNKDVLITLGDAQAIPFPMETKSGRLIISWETDTALTNTGYVVKVLSRAFNADNSPRYAGPQEFDITGLKNEIMYWSTASSTEGAYQKTRIVIFDKEPVYSKTPTFGLDNKCDNGAIITNGAIIIKEFNSTITVNANVGKTAKNVVGLTDVVESINTAGFTFTPWTEN